MAEAIVSGIIKQQVVDAGDICVTDISDERLKHFTSEYGVQASSENVAALEEADVVVLSIKPQVFPEVWPELVDALHPGALVVSIMAGISSRTIAGKHPIRVVRVMPNTPALVGEGAAGLAPGAFATDEDLELAQKLLAAVGVARIVKESEIDAVTALSGSGPAYVFYLLESMLAAAEKMELDPDTARELALSTVIGAAKLMKETGEEPAELRKKVTSKGGTTAAAIDMLENNGVKDSIIAALLAARARSVELANGEE